ncbi:MAG: LysR family transcriptional regulator [Tropicimonas sp.]|uniref:LysR family transcriptional regulator n=1 Tax=Tropicimonas sp. TaxID=2067044 RepID=UPI003A84B5C0
MDISQLKAILALSEELNFARAGAKLGISQPGLSQKIQRIEAEIGMTLFDRSQRRVVLTPAGAALVERLPDVLDTLDQALSRARRIARGDEGLLRVGFIENASFHLLPYVTTRLRRRFPNAQIELAEMISPEMPDALMLRNIDVALTRPFEGGDFRMREVMREPYAVALPESHPLARNDSVRITALAQLTFIAAAGIKANYLRAQFGPAFARRGFHLRVGQEVNQLPAIIALVAAGAGFTFLPRSATGIAIPGVCYRPIRDEDAPEAVLHVCARPKDANPLVASFFSIAGSFA